MKSVKYSLFLACCLQVLQGNLDKSVSWVLSYPFLYCCVSSLGERMKPSVSQGSGKKLIQVSVSGTSASSGLFISE